MAWPRPACEHPGAAAEYEADRDNLSGLADGAMSADPRVVAHVVYDHLTTITVPCAWSTTRLSREQVEPVHRGQYAKARTVCFIDITDSAHFVMLDHPERFAAALAEFLALAGTACGAPN